MVENLYLIGQFDRRNKFFMDFSNIHENPFIFLSWVTAIGLFISLIEATLIIRLENYNNEKKRVALVKSLSPKKLA